MDKHICQLGECACGRTNTNPYQLTTSGKYFVPFADADEWGNDEDYFDKDGDQ